MFLPKKIRRLCDISLSVLWLFTAVTSLFWGRKLGYDVLAEQGIDGELANLLINAGSLLDAFIGVWLLLPIARRWCYLTQIFTIVLYSLLLSIIQPSFWLHPFGPLSKNIPLLAFIYCLYWIETFQENKR